MGKLWEPQPRATYRYWIESILTESESKLTDWERHFLSSLDDWLNQRNLTEAQAERLESLYTKYTS